MADFKFEIKKTLGIISESAKGWKREVNVMQDKRMKIYNYISKITEC